MELCREELSWSADEILAAEYDFQSCFLDAELIGFYALEYLGGGLAELEALFVEPLHIGSGIGRCMLEHAKTRAAARGVTRIIIQGDPHAERFYRAAGALSCGSRASGSIPGRLLPLFELRLDRPLTDMEIENERNHLG